MGMTLPFRSRNSSGPALIVANLPSVVETLPTSTKPRFSTPRAVVKPEADPLKNSDAWPDGATRPLGVYLMIVVVGSGSV